MPEAKTFFRHCPACGRRFEIRLVSKKLVGTEEFVEKEEDLESGSRGLPIPLLLNEELPCVVDIDDFQYTYRCKHCGHEWSEVRTKEDREPLPDGFTGD
jgi:transcription elongation factor Elf1